MRIIISNRCFEKNTLIRNTIEIRVDYEKFNMKKKPLSKMWKHCKLCKLWWSLPLFSIPSSVYPLSPPCPCLKMKYFIAPCRWFWRSSMSPLKLQGKGGGGGVHTKNSHCKAWSYKMIKAYWNCDRKIL